MQVLIADDDRTSIAILSRTLRRWGYDVLTAHEGGAAWDALTRSTPPLVILDWMMPTLDGPTLCRRIRQSPALAQTYVIMLTARESRDDVVAGLEAGADDYLIKPFDPSELRARVNAGVRVVEANAETERLLASVCSIMIGIDGSGRITRWNSAAQETFQLSAGRAMGRTLTDCGIDWTDASRVQAVLQDPRNPPRFEDLVFTNREGQRVIVSLTVTTVHRGAAGLIVLGADVTERRVLEDHLRQAQQLERIGQLAAGVAHEINTPMQYVGDNIRFLQEAHRGMGGLLDAVIALCHRCETENVSADTRALVDTVVREAGDADLSYLSDEIPLAIEQSLQGVEHVSRIVKAMKDFSHPGTGEKVAVDLNRAIETTMTVAHNELKYVAETSTDLDPNLPLVTCLPGEINQVLLNLLINAAHAVEDAVQGQHARGRICVSTTFTGDVAEIRVSDTGTGIPEHARTRIFEPFFTTKPIGRGTGQGLALAHSVVVNKHGGQIWFETETGKGTTFFVRLPADAAA